MKLRKPSGTESVVNIEDIKIPTEYSKRLPSRDKIATKSDYFKKHKTITNPITVIPEINEKGKINKLMLVDGYTDYLILLFNGVRVAPVVYQNEYI